MRNGKASETGTLGTWLELAKVRITVMVTVTTAAGFILAAEEIALGMIPALLGIFLLACGSSALNHNQEYPMDALMERTKRRPVPSGKVTPQQALIFAMVLIFLGALVLFLGTNWMALALGLLAVVWYNGIYTYLKRRTAFAVVPGSLIGSIPPAVGWVAGGGGLLEPQALMIAFFFFIWQVPHFWLLLLLHGDDYERAGFPSLTTVFSIEQLARITFMWILATAMTCLLMPLFGIVDSLWVNAGLLLSSLWLIYQAVKLLRAENRRFAFGFAFRGINIYALLVLSLLSLGKLFI